LELKFDLHPGQLEVFNDPARFKVVVAGRRFGKSYLSAVKCLIEGLKMENEHGYDLSNKDVFYIAPTFNMAKDIMWRLLKQLGHQVIESTVENQGVLRLINGRNIYIKGSDKPDSLRGVGLSYVVLDEYATMKPETWEEIIRPTLADVKGGAFFIGTPAGKNHFYELFLDAQTMPKEWSTYEFKSMDNPFLAPEEIEAARSSMSRQAFRQEFEASFQMGSGTLFTESMVMYGDEPMDGSYFLSYDPAGFAEVAGKMNSKLKRLDEHAIACVKVGPTGWYVDDIVVGRWGIREASLRLLRLAQKYRPMSIGIEGGSLKNAIMPYVNDQMRRLSIYPRIQSVTHGGQKKTERITWALQGRMEHGRITFRKGSYMTQFLDQLMDFPNPMAHDDMLDALAYTDQIAKTIYAEQVIFDQWQPMDNISGY
jgi:hypothetical protein